jgi:hypothetical protein
LNYTSIREKEKKEKRREKKKKEKKEKETPGSDAIKFQS